MSELGPFHWYTSDLHFNHGNIIKYCERPFASMREMNQALVENWNSRVAPDEHVAVLGDFGFGSLDSLSGLVSRLNGRLTLVRGNHDRKAANMTGVGFANVVDSMYVSIAGYAVSLTHYPPKDVKRESGSYRERSPEVAADVVCAHGHTHSRERVVGRSIHVGVDAWDYRPVSAQEMAVLVRRIQGVEAKTTLPPPSKVAIEAVHVHRLYG
jgi:calcineurin-like phosphoesterase family protein